MHIRQIEASEDLSELTVMIRAAYAPHAERGLRYWATHQTVDDTAKRIARGVAFVGEQTGTVVATVALSRPDPDSKVALLREPTTWSFGQFAVHPAYKGMGFGKRLHDAALEYAAAHGCGVMALHTAQPAVELIEMYKSWGYAEVGTCDWRPHTNFLSVLMSKSLVSAVCCRNAS